MMLDCRALAEILELEDLADLDLAILLGTGWGTAFIHSTSLLLRLRLDDPVTGHQLLGSGEGTIDHRPLSPVKRNARALALGCRPLPPA
jgi:hypothetical protein